MIEDICILQNKQVAKLMADKNISEDLAKLIWGFGFQSVGRSMGKFGQISFFDYVIEQMEMLTKEDPERAARMNNDICEFFSQRRLGKGPKKRETSLKSSHKAK